MREDTRIRLPKDLADRIDEVRGGVPRDRWVRDVLAGALAGPAAKTTADVDPVLKERKRRSDKPFRPMPKS
jgi:hypothetical protein